MMLFCEKCKNSSRPSVIFFPLIFSIFNWNSYMCLTYRDNYYQFWSFSCCFFNWSWDIFSFNEVFSTRGSNVCDVSNWRIKLAAFELLNHFSLFAVQTVWSFLYQRESLSITFKLPLWKRNFQVLNLFLMHLVPRVKCTEVF
jgi:hypothetical protein